MNLKTTAILLILLLGVVGLTLLTQGIGPAARPGPDGDTAAGLEGAQPKTFVSGREFHRIEINDPRGRMSFAFDGERWEQDYPASFPADAGWIQDVINAGLSLTGQRPASDDTGRGSDRPSSNASDAEASPSGVADTGLGPGATEVRFVSDRGTFHLRLGRVTAAGPAYLAELKSSNAGDHEPTAEAPTWLVDPVLHRLLGERASGAWRPERLAGLNPEQVSQVMLKRAGRSQTLRRGDRGWSLDEAGGERVDAARVAPLLAAMAQLTPVSYVGTVDNQAAELQRYGLDQPRAELRISDGSGRWRHLQIGQEADLAAQTHYASWDEGNRDSRNGEEQEASGDGASPQRGAPARVVFTLPASLLESVVVEADAWRDRRLVLAEPETIRGQHVNRVGRDTVEAERRADGLGYRFVEPSLGYAPDPELLPQWLTTLTRVEPGGFVRAPREAQAPLAVVELRLAGGRSEHVRLYADRDGREDMVLAVRESEPIAMLVPGDQVATLLAPVVTLRDRRLPMTRPAEEGSADDIPGDATPPAGRRDAIRLTRDDGVEYVFKWSETDDERGRWSLEGFESEPWDRARFDRLREWLEAPRVASWTSMPELPRGPIARVSRGADRPAYSVNVDQGLASRTDLPGVFRLPEEVTDAVAAEYRPTLVVEQRVDQIASITVTPGSAGGDPVAGRSPGAAESEPGAGGTASAVGGPLTIRRDGGGRFSTQGQRLVDPEAAARLFDGLAGLRAKRFLPEAAEASDPAVSWRLSLRFDEATATLSRDPQGVWSDGGRRFYIDAQLDQDLVAAMGELTGAR